MSIEPENISKQQNAWNFISLFIYLALVAVTGYVFENKGIHFTEIELKEIIIISLATFRLTRIIVFEKIFKLFRDIVKSNNQYQLIKTIQFIITCPWCAGVWVMLAMVVFYFLVPYGVLFTYIMAISGIASLLVLLANWLNLTVDKKQKDKG